MELLSNIKYGRCFNFNIVHKECGMCCCECDNKCKDICNHAKYNFLKENCGNYYNQVDNNNVQLEKQKLINEKLRSGKTYAYRYNKQMEMFKHDK